jgi:3-deoxy-D-manno-octulosonate 8-phosphate phosphatase (KDO 8-P phosphatase)
VDQSVLERARHVELLVLDVDGVLTDGSLFFGPEGEVLKKFHVRDGAGIKAVLKAGIAVAVISSRSSRTVDTRMRELGVTEVLQGCSDKLDALDGILPRLRVDLGRVACMGDDVADVPMMQRVGFPVAVNDAHEAVKSVAHFCTAAPGGHGAVREVCDLLLMAR